MALGQFNVLVTSVSRKVPLLREVRRALVRLGHSGMLIGGDTDGGVVGRYFVDMFWEMPPLEALSLDKLLQYCRGRQVRAIVPTRDGELAFFADKKERLDKGGVQVMISPPDGVAICFDKLAFYKRLQHERDLHVIPTSEDLASLAGDSFVVKERYGAGAKKTIIGVSPKEAIASAAHLEFPVFQPYIEGTEYSIDLFVMRDGAVRGAIARARNLVVNGESQVTTTVHFPELEHAAARLVQKINLRGHVLCQAIVDNSGEFHFIECNCRFGGASTLAIAAGLDSFYWFFLECLGEGLEQYPFVRSSHGLRQVRYPEDLVIRDHCI